VVHVRISSRYLCLRVPKDTRRQAGLAAPPGGAGTAVTLVTGAEVAADAK